MSDRGETELDAEVFAVVPEQGTCWSGGLGTICLARAPQEWGPLLEREPWREPEPLREPGPLREPEP